MWYNLYKIFLSLLFVYVDVDSRIRVGRFFKSFLFRKIHTPSIAMLKSDGIGLGVGTFGIGLGAVVFSTFYI